MLCAYGVNAEPPPLLEFSRIEQPFCKKGLFDALHAPADVGLTEEQDVKIMVYLPGYSQSAFEGMRAWALTLSLPTP